MGTRGDRERDAARRQREAAETEHERAEQHGANEWLHRRVERHHREAAEVHERAAKMFDAHDDPNVSEKQAAAIVDRAIREARAIIDKQVDP